MTQKHPHTPKAKLFAAANAKSPVVSGRVASNEGGGAIYWLENGKRFVLSKEDCQSLGGPPRWKL